MSSVKQFVFIDDSGDPGFKVGSSSHFVIACAIFMDDLVAEEVSLIIKKYRRALGWNDLHEFKFNSTRKDIVRTLIKRVAKYDFRIRAVYIDKSDATSRRLLANQNSLYNQTIKELLERAPIKHANIRIDGRSNKIYMRSAVSYLRKELNKKTRKVESIRFDDSKRNDLIQLADVIAGSIGRSLNPRKSDSGEYIGLLSKRIDEIYKISSD